MLGEQVHGGADELGHRLCTRPAQKRCKSRDFDVVELSLRAVFALDLGFDELGEEVVLAVRRAASAPGRGRTSRSRWRLAWPSRRPRSAPGSRVSDTSIQCRICWATSSSCIPSMVVITSTGNGAENSCTASNPSGSTRLRYLSIFSMTNPFVTGSHAGVKTLFSRLRMFRWSGGSIRMIMFSPPRPAARRYLP